jgi:hypothetical protein
MILSRYKRRKILVSVVTSIEVYIKNDLEVDMGVVATPNMVEEVVDPPHVSSLVILLMYHDFELSHTLFVHIVIVLKM